MLVQQLPQHQLRHAAGALRAHVGMARVGPHDLLARRHPPDPRAGRHDLGEGVQPHHPAIDVHAQQARDQRRQELGVRGGRRGRRRAGADVGLHLQEVVGLVLEDEEVVLARDGVERAAAGGALRRARRVLPRRHGVEQEGLAAARVVPGREEGVEGGGDEALGVHGDADDADAQRGGGLDGGREGVFFGEEDVAAVREHAQRHVERRRAADGEGGAPVGVRRVVHQLGVLGHEAQQLGGAGALRVVEGGADVVEGAPVREIVLPRVQGRAGGCGGRFGEVRGGGDFDGEGLEGEVFT